MTTDTEPQIARPADFIEIDDLVDSLRWMRAKMEVLGRCDEHDLLLIEEAATALEIIGE